ncbi:hypothetical protein KSP39_PZI010073 [Platanthera zijinensis]|uniref:Biogenesis of lysosome-related organelles complex 1 subunit 7 n=1 Tax=Platanthera zijinensis TaxID=2320716 RepID=A0AAP0BJW9_9ASPA
MDGEVPPSQLAGPVAAIVNAAAAAADASPDQTNSGEAEFSSRREGCEAIAKAISSTLGAVMTEFDSGAEGASRSQEELCSAIDRLTGELDKLLEGAPLPFIMQNAAKIISVRRRVSSLNLVLKSVQRRLDNIDRMLSTGLPANGAPVEVLSCDIEVTGSSPGSSLLQKCRVSIHFTLVVGPFPGPSLRGDAL